eukprot:73888-Alexandrium_andersonii.AAC.1
MGSASLVPLAGTTGSAAGRPAHGAQAKQGRTPCVEALLRTLVVEVTLGVCVVFVGVGGPGSLVPLAGTTGSAAGRPTHGAQAKQ